MNNIKKEPRLKYSINCYEVEKNKYFKTIIFKKEESPTIMLPFIKNDKMYNVKYKWKKYLCNEKNLKSFKLFFTSDEIKDIPENILYTQNDLIFWILLQTDFSKYWNPYEKAYYFNEIMSAFFKMINIEAKEWFEKMCWITYALYWIDVWHWFYRNSCCFVDKPLKTEEEILKNLLKCLKKGGWNKTSIYNKD
jgi:hypothetical protein